MSILCRLCKNPIRVIIARDGTEYDLDSYYRGDASAELQDMGYEETCDYYSYPGECGQTVYTPVIEARCQCGNALISREEYLKLLTPRVDEDGVTQYFEDYIKPHGLTVADSVTVRRGFK